MNKSNLLILDKKEIIIMNQIAKEIDLKVKELEQNKVSTNKMEKTWKI